MKTQDPTNPQPCPRPNKKPKTLADAKAETQKQNDARALRRARLETIHATLREQYQPEIENALVQNTIARQKRDAEEAKKKTQISLAAATAGPGFRGRGPPGPGQSWPPGPSSLGKRPAGDHGLSEHQRKLLHLNEVELEKTKCKEFARQLRKLLRGLESDAEYTDDEEGRKKPRTSTKPKPQPLDFGILVQVLYQELIVGRAGKKATGGGGKNAPVTRAAARRHPLPRRQERPGDRGGGTETQGKTMLHFYDSNGHQYEHIQLGPTDNDDGILRISPEKVVRVKCDDVHDTDLICSFTPETYEEKVAKIPSVLKILQKYNITMLEKSKPPLSATTRSEPNSSIGAA